MNDNADARRRLLEQVIRQHAPRVAATAAPDEPRVEPASFAQRRLWLVEQVQQTEAPYTLHAVQRLRFRADARLLEEAIREIARRHEVLRTSFELVDDDIVQRVQPHPSLSLRSVDLRSLPPAERQAAALDSMSNTLRQRFDLRQGPLLRAELYTIGEGDDLLLIAVHHIVFDWQSFQIFFRELDAIYSALLANRPHGLPPIQEQYGAFAREQRLQLSADRMAAEVDFWRAELAALPTLDLPLDRVRPRVPTFRGSQLGLRLPATLVGRLRQRAVDGKATLFTALLVGLGAALGRVCRQRDFAIGLPATGRDSAGRQDALGFFVDTLVVRLRWADDATPDDLIAMGRDAMRRVLSHRRLPFELLVQHLHAERDLGLHPLFQVGFQLMQAPMTPSDGAHAIDPPRTGAMFDICIDLWPEERDLCGRVQFNEDVLDPGTVDMLCQAFTATLGWLSESQTSWSELGFDALAMSTPPSLLSGEARRLPARSCLELIAEVASRVPEAVAVKGQSRCITYGELVPYVERLAGALTARGLRRGAVALLEVPRSPELVLLQLAIMRAGAAFACADPTWPADRRAAVGRLLGAPLVVDPMVLAELASDLAAPIVGDWPDAHDLAYVIFTSGSSGEPKGVAIEHVGLANVAAAQRQLFGLGPGRCVGQLASPSFDASIFEITMALCSGATLAVAPSGVIAGDELTGFIRAAGVDAIVIPPSVLATADADQCHCLRLVTVAGESCPADLAERFGAGRTFWNLYGPTETTIWATAGRSIVGAKVAIGGPISNMSTAVVDERGRVVPIGVVGELCVSGVGLARGYLNPASTERAFVPAPPALAMLSGSSRAYRTGDLVRQLRSGELVFVGRADRQVKVRGLRIEPEEVERVLRRHPDISDVLVDAVEVAGEAVLVAYLQTTTAEIDALLDACRGLLHAQLPVYLCPSHFVAVDTFPRLPSGKVDRAALPPPGGQTAASPAVPLATEAERQLAAIVERLLHRAPVGATDNFFRIGGHSLAAAQLTARVRAAFGVEIRIADVFAHPTVSALAAYVTARRELSRHDMDDDVPLVPLPRAPAQ